MPKTTEREGNSQIEQHTQDYSQTIAINSQIITKEDFIFIFAVIDIGDREDDGHGDGENGEEENELGDSGAEEHVVDIESFLGLAGGHWMVSLMGEDLLSFILSQLD